MRPDRLTHGGGRLGLEIVRLVDTWYRRRQRLGQRSVRVRALSRVELGEELEDARATLGGLVEVHVQVRDPLDPEPLPELVPDERHSVTQRRDGGISFSRLPDDAHPDLGVAEVGRRLDLGDGDEPDTRIRHIPTDDLADLLPQELVDPLGSLAHGRPSWPTPD
jgi:hypothetical protein